MFRRTLFSLVGEFDESWRYTQDHDYIIRILQKMDITFEERPVAHYRLHHSNTTGYLQGDQHFTYRPVIAEASLVRMSYGIAVV